MRDPGWASMLGVEKEVRNRVAFGKQRDEDH
jgi:hypothetical protein